MKYVSQDLTEEKEKLMDEVKELLSKGTEGWMVAPNPDGPGVTIFMPNGMTASVGLKDGVTIPLGDIDDYFLQAVRRRLKALGVTRPNELSRPEIHAIAIQALINSDLPEHNAKAASNANDKRT